MRRAFPICALAPILTVLPCPPSQAATLFQQDFQTAIDPMSGEPVLRCSGPGGAGTYPFPPGWFLRNVDNRTPDAQVAYVNEAWEVREDFGADVNNCVAFSTSFYSPVGAANDWMWTPLIGPIPGGVTRLTWRARIYDSDYPDGYEVRIMVAPNVPTGGTGAIGNQITNSTAVFSIGAEEAAWTQRQVNLSSFTGQSIYIGFRNNSNDKFLLVIDDIVVEDVTPFDPELIDATDVPTQGYAKLPAPLGYGFDLQARVRSSGLSALTGVTVEADLLVEGVPHASFTSPPIANLASNAMQTVTVGSAVYDQIGTWSLDALVTANEGDQRPANSALSMDITEVTADELTRAVGPATGALGIGTDNGGELGNDFEVPVAAALRAARATINNSDAVPDGEPPGDGVGDFNGYTLSMVVRGWNTGANEPGALLATSTVSIPDDAAAEAMTLQFDFEDLILPPGRYLLAMLEPTLPAPRTLALHTMPQRITPGTVWVNWPTSPFGGWANIEEFGPQFVRTFDITAILGLPVYAPVAQDDAFSVPEDGTFAGDVALNDTRSDEGGNEWAASFLPASGTLAIQPSGAFEYTPAAGTAGSTVTFGYTVCDVNADCDSASVELQIQVNTPIAQDDAFTVPPLGGFAGDVSPNDTPSIEGGSVWNVVLGPASGTLVMQPSGAFVYTPDAGAAGSTLGFEYSLCDVDADCDNAQVELQVLALPIFADSFESAP